MQETQYRAIAARANYLARDRADVLFAAKEFSRFMSKPEAEDWSKAKRLGRYLKDNLRVVLEYKFQKMPEKTAAGSDADFAGRKRTRRSTSD